VLEPIPLPLWAPPAAPVPIRVPNALPVPEPEPKPEEEPVFPASDLEEADTLRGAANWRISRGLAGTLQWIGYRLWFHR
jgi:hypothetical protein